MKKILVMIMLLLPPLSFAQITPDYLILQDIGQYRISKPEKLIPGFAPIGGPRAYDSAGVIAGAGHLPDHLDKTYEVMYFGGDANASPTVQVTQHPGSDSDRWLLHEVDADFRNYYGIPGISYAVVPLDGNTVFEFGSAGWDYRWLSGNKVIMIEYHDPEMTKPEPLEVVKAYLAKHPSTIPAVTLEQLRSTEYKTQWIKDEMDRRLWPCDKWFEQYQLGKVDQGKVLDEAVDHMNVFLDYREKYYGISAKDEKITLDNYLQQKDEPSIKSKLTEYKTWWSANKTGTINLP